MNCFELCRNSGSKSENAATEQGGPGAESMKILTGDILIEVDGLPIAGKALPEVQRLLAGEVHSPVTLMFLRRVGGNTRNVVVTLSRQRISPGAKRDRITVSNAPSPERKAPSPTWSTTSSRARAADPFRHLKQVVCTM